MSNTEKNDMARASVPSTARLQASIIAQTEGLPQSVDFIHGAVKPERRWSRFFQLGVPVAACCIVALVMLVNPGSWTHLNSELNRSLLVSDELDWQEIMLLEDEWLLADL